jgi:ubiquinone/menaquinone biosynthesis C-methylase UbiE
MVKTYESIKLNGKITLMQQEYPEGFAKFYDLMYSHLRDGVDNEFFLQHIRNSERILEIGVGTGRFFMEALEGGADIQGIDVSEHMLRVLKNKLSEDQHYRISQQDFIHFSFDRKFDLIIAPFRVIMHIHEKEDQLLALNNAFRHLEPGGLLIFDAFIPKLDHIIHGLHKQVDFEEEYKPGRTLKRTVSTRPSLIRQRIDIHFMLEWDTEQGMQSETWDTSLRFLFRYELEHLLERSRFDSFEILGDYLGNPLNDKSGEFVVICKKQEDHE